MKELVKHLVRENLQGIANNSLLNCHCMGLHSLMLLDAPGKTIRLYVAVESHEMYRNDYPFVQPLSIALHPHHCNLTLHCVKGSFINYGFRESIDGIGVPLDKYYYHSKILEGQMSFERLGQSRMHTIEDVEVREGESISIHASEIHTVYVRKGKFAAWLVYEGAEWEQYKPYSWSNIDLTTSDSTGLYIKTTQDDVLYLLRKCGLL